MKSVQKAIFIDWRYPRTKEEKEFFGLTEYENEHVAKVFINTHIGKNQLTDTFFHEMAHVFFAFHRKNRRMSDKKEEALADQIGKTCAYLLR